MGDDHGIGLDQLSILGVQAFFGDALGEDRPLDFAAESFELVDLFLVSGGTLHVNAGDLLGTHVVGADGDVHAGVTGTDDHDPAADFGLQTVVDVFEEIQPP